MSRKAHDSLLGGFSSLQPHDAVAFFERLMKSIGLSLKNCLGNVRLNCDGQSMSCISSALRKFDFKKVDNCQITTAWTTSQLSKRQLRDLFHAFKTLR